MEAEFAQGPENARLGALHRRRSVLVPVLSALNAFVLGGLVALLLVNRLLYNQAAIYMPRSVPAADAILDVADDLVLHWMIYGGVLLALLLVTANAWAWLVTESRPLRYGVLLFSVLILVLVIGALASGWGVEAPPAMTPTPTALSG